MNPARRAVNSASNSAKAVALCFEWEEREAEEGLDEDQCDRRRERIGHSTSSKGFRSIVSDSVL